MLGFLLVAVALAGEFIVETPPFADRVTAEAMEARADATGARARVVRRFRLGHGWEFVVVVSGVPSEPEARALADRLGAALGLDLVVSRLDEGDPVRIPAGAAPEPPARTPADWVADATRAHGGPGGGGARLAVAESVHFSFERTVRLADTDVTIAHDYWRAGAERRLAVDTRGAAVDSVAVVSPAGAWLRAAGEVRPRDVGMTLEAVDGFAPEAILTVALEIAPLLRSPEVDRFDLLEGAGRAVRLGSGTDEPGLSYIDIDPASARILRLRYVTEGGPIEWELGSWREVAVGVWAPFDVAIERADGRRERIRVQKLEVDRPPPEGSFSAPAP